jgi:hypothetical protein
MCFGRFVVRSALWAFCGAFCALGVLRRVLRFGRFAARSAIWAFLQNLIIYA